MNIEQFLQDKVRAAVTALYGEPAPGQVQIQKTRKEFDGDMTLVVFPLLKLSRKNPDSLSRKRRKKQKPNRPQHLLLLKNPLLTSK